MLSSGLGLSLQLHTKLADLCLPHPQIFLQSFQFRLTTVLVLSSVEHQPLIAVLLFKLLDLEFELLSEVLLLFVSFVPVILSLAICASKLVELFSHLGNDDGVGLNLLFRIFDFFEPNPEHVLRVKRLLVKCIL